MTIQERLCFIRAGYSARDIAGFEAAEADPAPAADPAEETPVWAAALAKSIQDMTKAMQANNARFADMGDPVSVEQKADEILAAYARGGKSNNGGTNK